MKKMQIFEPAMCCPTGLCGVSVDPELLRISTVLNSLEKNGIKIDRYNLTNSPQEFIRNKNVNSFVRVEGVNALPITVIDGEIIITGRYPKNEEFVKLLNIPMNFIDEYSKNVKTTSVNNTECCSDGCCPDGCCSDDSCW